MLKNSMIKAGNNLLKGSLTFMCMHTAPIITKEATRAEGKTKTGFHNPKISKIAVLILMNPIT